MVQARHLESQLEALMATEALRVYLKHQIESSNFIVSESDALKIHFRLVGGTFVGLAPRKSLLTPCFLRRDRKRCPSLVEVAQFRFPVGRWCGKLPAA